MDLKTKAGIRIKQKIAEHQKSGCFSAKIIRCLTARKTGAGKTRKQKIADNQKSGYISAEYQKSGYLSAKIVIDGSEHKSWNKKEAEGRGASEIRLFIH
jgi:hypothetical protein